MEENVKVEELELTKKEKFAIWCTNHPKMVKAGRIAIDIVGLTLVGIAAFMLGENVERANWTEVEAPVVEETSTEEKEEN